MSICWPIIPNIIINFFYFSSYFVRVCLYSVCVRACVYVCAFVRAGVEYLGTVLLYLSMIHPD